MILLWVEEEQLIDFSTHGITYRNFQIMRPSMAWACNATGEDSFDV